MQDLIKASQETRNIWKRVRVREHVNPLGERFQSPIPPPDWEAIYVDWSQPLSLDIGCGRGKYILQMAQQHPEWNFLGLEIRQPLVEQAIAIQQELGLTNLYYLFCNVNVSLAGLLPKAKVQQVTIQFPDPWFKRRQQKRRTVQPELVATLADLVMPGGQVLLQSDILAVAKEMRDRFEANDQFVNVAGDKQFADNSVYPAHLPTEREQMVLQQGGMVYRAHFQRK